MAARETADFLLSTDILSLCGNHDRWFIEKKRDDMISIDGAAFDQLEEHHLRWLRKLPTIRIGNPGWRRVGWIEPSVPVIHLTAADTEDDQKISFGKRCIERACSLFLGGVKVPRYLRRFDMRSLAKTRHTRIVTRICLGS